MKSTDHYRTMEIERTATVDEIKYAYRRLAKRFHPDVSTDPDGESKFKAVADAYWTLKHPEMRLMYDKGHLPTRDEEDIKFDSGAWQAWLIFYNYPIWVQLWGYWQFMPHSKT